VVILIVGWFISSLIEKGVAALLRAVRFNELAERSGFAGFVSKMNAGVDSAGMIGLVAEWFVRLIAMVVAFDALGLPAVSDVLRQLLLWLPNVVVALVVLVIGGLAARALSNLVRGAASEAGITNSEFLAKLASVMVWAFAIVVAVNQIGIATTLVNTLFMAFVGALALAAGWPSAWAARTRPPRSFEPGTTRAARTAPRSSAPVKPSSGARKIARACTGTAARRSSPPTSAKGPKGARSTPPQAHRSRSQQLGIWAAEKASPE